MDGKEAFINKCKTGISDDQKKSSRLTFLNPNWTLDIQRIFLIHT